MIFVVFSILSVGYFIHGGFPNDYKAFMNKYESLEDERFK